MKPLFMLLLLPVIYPGTQSISQPAKKQVGVHCDGCKAIYESPVPFDKLRNMAWLPDWNESGPQDSHQRRGV